MIFEETKIPGVWLLKAERISDERGYFARTYCRDTFAERGLQMDVTQCNVSYNRRSGTVRGLHLQLPPHGEIKIVSCTQGAIWDVAVDLREGSPSFGKWASFELEAGNERAVYLPEGIAHGFQALADNTIVYYQMGAPYIPESAAGVRFDDPGLAIPWPLEVTALSPRDANLPALKDFARQQATGPHSAERDDWPCED